MMQLPMVDDRASEVFKTLDAMVMGNPARRGLKDDPDDLVDDNDDGGGGPPNVPIHV